MSRDSWEYKTTMSFSGVGMPDGAFHRYTILDPKVPSGFDWELRCMAATETTVYWTWRRSNLLGDIQNRNARLKKRVEKRSRNR